MLPSELPVEEEKPMVHRALCDNCFGFTEVKIECMRDIILHIMDMCHSCGTTRTFYATTEEIP